MIGDVKAIDDAITALNQNRLVIKIVEGLKRFLSWDNPILSKTL